MSEQIKNFFLMPRKLVLELSPAARLVFLEICCRARYNGNVSNPAGIELNLGECFIGRRDLAHRTGLSEQNVRTALKELTSNQLVINQRSTNKGTVVVIGNLGIITQQPTSHQPHINQPSTTNIPEPIPEPRISRRKNPTKTVKLGNKAGARIPVSGEIERIQELLEKNEAPLPKSERGLIFKLLCHMDSLAEAESWLERTYVRAVGTLQGPEKIDMIRRCFWKEIKQRESLAIDSEVLS